jgi:hypothetical protein
LTRSRCGAGTISTPLSRSRAHSLPSLNPGNDNTVSDTTHLPRKTGRGGKSYRNRGQRTDQSPQVTNLLLVTVGELTSYQLVFCLSTTVTRRPPFIFDYFSFGSKNCDQHILLSFVVFFFFFFYTRSTSFNSDRPPHRGKIYRRPEVVSIWGTYRYYPLGISTKYYTNN